MHLVGFTIEIYHDARSHERQRYQEVCGLCTSDLLRVTRFVHV